MTRRCVYVVDDEEPIRKSCRLMLMTQGFHVTVFESGVSLLEVAEALVPGAVLLDVRMPDMDGVEVQKRLNAKGTPHPVVVMTGHADLAIAVAALQQGAVALIEKPFSKSTVNAALNTAFRKLEDPAGYRVDQVAAAASVSALDQTDKTLLASLAKGHSKETIAAQLGMSTAAVEMRRARLLSDLGAESLTEAVSLAVAAGLGPEHARIRNLT